MRVSRGRRAGAGDRRGCCAEDLGAGVTALRNVLEGVSGGECAASEGDAGGLTNGVVIAMTTWAHWP